MLTRVCVCVGMLCFTCSLACSARLHLFAVLEPLPLAPSGGAAAPHIVGARPLSMLMLYSAIAAMPS